MKSSSSLFYLQVRNVREIASTAISFLKGLPNDPINFRSETIKSPLSPQNRLQDQISKNYKSSVQERTRFADQTYPHYPQEQFQRINNNKIHRMDSESKFNTKSSKFFRIYMPEISSKS